MFLNDAAEKTCVIFVPRPDQQQQQQQLLYLRSGCWIPCCGSADRWWTGSWQPDPHWSPPQKVSVRPAPSRTAPRSRRPIRSTAPACREQNKLVFPGRCKWNRERRDDDVSVLPVSAIQGQPLQVEVQPLVLRRLQRPGAGAVLGGVRPVVGRRRQNPAYCRILHCASTKSCRDEVQCEQTRVCVKSCLF